jgi:hypothetical protein
MAVWGVFKNEYVLQWVLEGETGRRGEQRRKAEGGRRKADIVE